MDAVFKALSDPTRRDLLDEMFREDGQSRGPWKPASGWPSTSSCSRKPDWRSTAVGAAHELHFLNQVPIRLIRDRWVSKYGPSSIWSRPRPRGYAAVGLHAGHV